MADGSALSCCAVCLADGPQGSSFLLFLFSVSYISPLAERCALRGQQCWLSSRVERHLTLCGIDVFDLAGLVIVRLDSPFVIHFVKFLESFGQSMDSWSSLVARENRCIFEYV